MVRRGIFENQIPTKVSGSGAAGQRVPASDNRANRNSDDRMPRAPMRFAELDGKSVWFG